MVEDVECIIEVEVLLHGQVNLSRLKLLLEVAELFQGVNKLIFIVESQNGLSGRRKS